MYQYIFFRLQYNGTMPSINTIEMFPVVIASAWHELIPPLLRSITFIIIFWVSSQDPIKPMLHLQDHSSGDNFYCIIQSNTSSISPQLQGELLLNKTPILYPKLGDIKANILKSTIINNIDMIFFLHLCIIDIVIKELVSLHDSL